MTMVGLLVLIGCGEINGKIFAYTDREYFLYHFPRMLEGYMGRLKKDLGYQSETSIVLGLDWYHYDEAGGYMTLG